MVTEPKASIKIAVRAIAMIASIIAVPAWWPTRFLVDVGLQTIAGNVGDQRTGAWHAAGLPRQGYSNHFHVVAVTRGDGRVGNRHGPDVGDPLIGRLRVIIVRKCRGNEASCVDLVPTVKPQ